VNDLTKLPAGRCANGQPCVWTAEMGLPQPADLESIQDTAWQRTLDFFAKYLK